MTFLQTQLRDNIRRIDTHFIMFEHFSDRAAGFDDQVRRNALTDQIAARYIAIGHVDVCRVIDNAANDFLGHTHIETAVAGFHMESRDLPALGRNDRRTAIGIA